MTATYDYHEPGRTCETCALGDTDCPIKPFRQCCHVWRTKVIEDYAKLDTVAIIVSISDYKNTDEWPEGALGDLLNALIERNGDYRVNTPLGALVATYTGDADIYEGIDICLETPQGSSQLTMAEVVGAEAAGDYPTPVHSFTWNGDEEEPQRVDFNLDGEYAQF